MQDLIELVHIITTLKEWATTEKLGQDTANGPDINCRKSVDLFCDTRSDNSLALV